MVTDSIAPRPSAEMLGHIQHPSIPAVCVFVCVCLWNAAVHPESSSNSQGSVTFHVHIPDVFSGMQDSHHMSYLHPWIPRRDARKNTHKGHFCVLFLTDAHRQKTQTANNSCSRWQKQTDTVLHWGRISLNICSSSVGRQRCEQSDHAVVAAWQRLHILHTANRAPRSGRLSGSHVNVSKTNAFILKFYCHLYIYF